MAKHHLQQILESGTLMLEIRCLGAFIVLRDGKPLSNLSEWGGRKRNLRLLKILLTPPGKRFTSDDLIEGLWPGENRDPENYSKRNRELKTAFTELRKILEPSLENGLESSFIKTSTDKQAYYFDCTIPLCSIDTVTFLQLSNKAKQFIKNDAWGDAQSQLEQALQLYTGEYLEDDKLEEWNQSFRRELQINCANLNILLSECYSRAGNLLGAIDCCHSAIKLDPSRKAEVTELIARYSRARLERENTPTPKPSTPRDQLETQFKPSLQAPKPATIRPVPILWALPIILVAGLAIYLLFGRNSPVEPGEVLAQPEIQYFQLDRNAFNMAAYYPPIMVDFEEFEAGEDILGRTINGVRFEKSSLSSAPLLVVRASDTFSPAGFRCEPIGDRSTHVLTTSAGSGGKVLSPGGPELAPGPNPALEDDGLQMIFEEPVSAIGFDLIFQSVTGTARLVTLYDPEDREIFSKKVDFSLGTPGVAAPGFNLFVGFVSSSKNIAKVVVEDLDQDNCLEDSNNGYDTIRFRMEDEKSPLGLPQYNFDRQWGQPGTNPGEFNSDVGPRGLAIVEGEKALIYVADYTTGRIESFTSDGRFVAMYLFESASQDIEYDGKGSFYVRGVAGMLGVGGIAKLDSNLNLLWTTEAKAAEWVSFGLCLDSDGNLHVPVASSLSEGEIHMEKYDPDGNLLLKYGYGQINGAASCAASKGGSVFVTAGAESGLRRFSNDGLLLETTQFSYNIKAIAISPVSGNILLAMNIPDETGQVVPTIREYDSKFVLLSEWGGSGEGNGKFSGEIRDMEFDAKGNLYISDGKNFMVQSFQRLED